VCVFLADMCIADAVTGTDSKQTKLGNRENTEIEKKRKREKETAWRKCD
jgi:hypothetical protein